MSGTRRTKKSAIRARTGSRQPKGRSESILRVGDCADLALTTGLGVWGTPMADSSTRGAGVADASAGARDAGPGAWPPGARSQKRALEAPGQEDGPGGPFEAGLRGEIRVAPAEISADRDLLDDRDLD